MIGPVLGAGLGWREAEERVRAQFRYINAMQKAEMQRNAFIGPRYPENCLAASGLNEFMKLMTGKQYKQAGYFWQSILLALGAHAIVMPWGRAYIMPKHDCEQLRKHEQVHLDQVKRYGGIRFTVKYLWWLARYGYYWHPLEIEARVKSGEQEAKKAWLAHPVLGPLLKNNQDISR